MKLFTDKVSEVVRSKMDKIQEAKKVFDIEIAALKCTRDSLDETFVKILDLVIGCQGKVIVTGMGKPGHIGAKMAATFASLGTPSFYLHPGEAMHGDLGMISQNDIVVAISYSGESDEIVRILPNIKMIGAVLVAITGNAKSTLAQAADIVQVFPNFDEACYLGLAPTSSTTVTLCYGDALAVVASKVYGFGEIDFGKYHPAGSLGKKLILRVEDLMSAEDKNATVRMDSTLKDAVIELSKKGLGMVSVIDEFGVLKGIITDGDLRRLLEKGIDIYDMSTEEVMTRYPITTDKNELAVEALNVLKEKNIAGMPVTENGKAVGTIRLQDIVNKGIVC